MRRASRSTCRPPRSRHPNGDIFVSDGYGQNWIHRFSAKGELIRSWGGGDPVFIQQFRGEPVTGVAATEPGKFNLPHDVHVSPDGTVFVMDRENLRWQTFDVDGEYRRAGQRREPPVRRGGGP